MASSPSKDTTRMHSHNIFENTRIMKSIFHFNILNNFLHIETAQKIRPHKDDSG